jgi:repA
MAKVENKQMFQSYIFTTAKYDFSVYEKRILYRKIEIEQALLNDEALQDCIKIDTNLWGDKKYTVPISMLLANEEDKNYSKIKKAFKDLKSKNIEYEDEKEYSCFGVIDKFWIDKYGKNVTWQSDKRIVEAVMDFSKGWRKYELKIAMQFESIYAMRFYELIAGKRNHITYEVAFLEKMFMLENKYRNPQGKLNISKFKIRVLEPAKKELDKCSPYTFDYYLSKDKKMITIIPVFQEQYADEKMKKAHLEQEKRDLYSVLGEREIEVFTSEFGFTEQGLRNNYLLFQECKKELPENYSFFLFQEIRKSLKRKKKIDPAYVIGIIKNMLEDYKQEKQRQ